MLTASCYSIGGQREAGGEGGGVVIEIKELLDTCLMEVALETVTNARNQVTSWVELKICQQEI